MSDKPDEVTITVKEARPRPWEKPNSTQVWWSVVTEEHPSEPTKFIQDTAKNAPDPLPGKKYLGAVWATTPDRFYAKEEVGAESSSAPAKKEWQSDEEFYGNKSAEIKAQWAIRQAVKLYSVQKDEVDKLLKEASMEMDDIDFIERQAVELYAMVDRVKGSSESTNPKATKTSTEQAENSAGTSSGYDKFKASRPMALNEADEQSLYNSIAQAENLEVPAEFN